MITEDLSKLKIQRGVTLARRRPSRSVVLAAAFIAALALAWAGYARFGAATEVQTVTVATVYPAQAFTVLNATGYVVAQRKAAVSSKATGRLEWLGVLEGSRVKAGDVIARLEHEDVAATREQAAANLKVAKANLDQGIAELHEAELALKRSLDLVNKGFISQASHDSAIARFDKDKASIESLRAAVSAASANEKAAQVAVEQTLIRAPFDGVVLTKNANVGDIITPFSSALDAKGAVVTMADMRTLEVEADVAESSLAKIGVNQACEIQLDAFPELRLAGVVSRIVPTVDRSKATVLVKVRFTDHDPRVLPDMSAKVAFLAHAVGQQEKQAKTAAQPAAVVARKGRTVVFVVNGSKVRETPVQTGDKLGDLVELKGVQPGEKLVLNPASNLEDGSTVKLAVK